MKLKKNDDAKKPEDIYWNEFTQSMERKGYDPLKESEKYVQYRK